jgi:hypothetical protein
VDFTVASGLTQTFERLNPMPANTNLIQHRHLARRSALGQAMGTNGPIGPKTRSRSQTVEIIRPKASSISAAHAVIPAQAGILQHSVLATQHSASAHPTSVGSVEVEEKTRGTWHCRRWNLS